MESGRLSNNQLKEETMNPRFFSKSRWRASALTLSLVAVLLAVSCAPAPATEAVDSVPADQTSATATTVPATEAVAESATDALPVVEAVATSRGSDLHATDPATVSLASGQLQLVEFFRFT
jgi:hypothetical protein